MALQRDSDHYRGLLKLLCLATGANDASIWLPTAAGSALAMVHSLTLGADDPLPVQSLDEGVISGVFRSGSLLEDTGMFRNPLASKEIDHTLEQRTTALMAAPIRIAGAVVGVLSIVQIITQDKMPAQWGFRPDSAEILEEAAGVLAALG
jgi:hypothetical protein